MASLKSEDIARVKVLEFLQNRGTEQFSGRLVPKGSVFSAENLAVISECAKQFGNGKVAFASRLNAEIIGISCEKINETVAFMAQGGLYFGGTKIRPVTVCKGITCIF